MPIEKQRQKSPAEFFSDNAAIAGFDNPGKSLYTTVRELVENALDAAESVSTLPTIGIEIKEMNQAEFNAYRGVLGSNERKDGSLFGLKEKKSKKRKLLDGEGAGGDEEEGTTAEPVKEEKEQKGKKRGAKSEDQYYIVTVKDNGCGMAFEAIPNMLGIVLSGSKYGVRQTRGKFGLGAKMALIWGKKSTGVPVKVVSAHMTEPGTIPKTVTTCVLDIDIYKNRPRTEVHEETTNTEEVIGTEFQVVVGGNWKSHGKYIKSYLQKLAIITPYAEFKFDFIPTERICQILKTVTEFGNPDGTCLSPAGEYNLRLGIERHYKPDHLFTCTSKADAHEGHPFLVEVGVAYGGNCRDKVNVTRFANRIPLLFEPGADVSKKICDKLINWKSYHMDPVANSIEVFVSIVSTKIPFKGTGKEYIGDNINAIKQRILTCIQSCCRQIKEILGKRKKLGDAKSRRNKLAKYVPDATNAIFGIVETVAAKKAASTASSQSPYSKLLSDVKSKTFTKKKFEEKLLEIVDKEVKEAENQDLLDAKKTSVSHPDEQLIYLKPLDHEKDLAWGETVKGGNFFFVPSQAIIDSGDKFVLK
ncbi:hypothetical protein TrCOL_g5938 [Triparma columacea]|uniref:DNA topoisomerase VI subunit B transducer domain-containing protein n=1 Tax=Triparma columacea TaxID=722753 RepID=A0A9W7L9R4_9STRA|nr:hypothetical protein TrCOL_g5938 [Triparma columacea]